MLLASFLGPFAPPAGKLETTLQVCVGTGARRGFARDSSGEVAECADGAVSLGR